MAGRRGSCHSILRIFFWHPSMRQLLMLILSVAEITVPRLVCQFRIFLLYCLVEQIQCLILRCVALEVVLHCVLELLVAALVISRKLVLEGDLVSSRTMLT